MELICRGQTGREEEKVSRDDGMCLKSTRESAPIRKGIERCPTKILLWNLFREKEDKKRRGSTGRSHEEQYSRWQMRNGSRFLLQLRSGGEREPTRTHADCPQGWRWRRQFKRENALFSVWHPFLHGFGERFAARLRQVMRQMPAFLLGCCLPF